jgi:ketosteroid isomerase-like protein
MGREDVVKKYLEYQDSGNVEGVLGLLSDDAVLVYPMGTSSGKAQVEQALRSRPGMVKPDYGEITVEGDRARVSGKLPPGMMISAVNLAFEFDADLIKRIEITMA